jgi:hypothetical protein
LTKVVEILEKEYKLYSHVEVSDLAAELTG